MQQLPDIEKTDSTEETSCLKGTVYNARRKVSVNFQTDTDKLNNNVYHYWNNLYLKDNEVDLKLTEYQSLLQNECIFWAILAYSTSDGLYWMKQLFIVKTNSVKKGCFFPHEIFPIVTGIKIVSWTR